MSRLNKAVLCPSANEAVLLESDDVVALCLIWDLFKSAGTVAAKTLYIMSFHSSKGTDTIIGLGCSPHSATSLRPGELPHLCLSLP